MSFKPKSNLTKTDRDPNYVPKVFVTAEPEEGLRPAAVSAIISLGTQKREPYEKTDDKNNVITDENGDPVIISPDPNEQVAMYVDLLDDMWDYGEEIGVKQIREPIHEEFAGNIKDGLNFIEIGHFTPKGEYIQGKPWTLPSAGMFAKIAKACGAPEIMEAGGYGEGTKYGPENPDKSDISLLLGKPFLINVDVNKRDAKDRDGNDITYVNVKLKTPVPLMKGMTVAELEAEPLMLTFDSEVDEIVENINFIRAAARKKIMKAIDYEGSNMNKAFIRCGVNKWGNITPEGSQEPQEEKKEAPKEKAPAVKKTAKKAVKKVVQKPAENFDDDVPF